MSELIIDVSAVAVIHEQVLFLYFVLRWSAHAVRTNSSSSHHRQQGRHRHCEVLAHRARPARDGHQVRWKPYSRFVVFCSVLVQDSFIRGLSLWKQRVEYHQQTAGLQDGSAAVLHRLHVINPSCVSHPQEVHSSSTLTPLTAVMWLRTVPVWLTARWTDRPHSLSSPKMLEKVPIL